eukprot:TRINITY_DN1857_c0_g1_i2.p1 TRINITY_DN1857_c0_g1~~TRINITY_DN1857_c0_g1_i2.p1  ORF type:complete len:545 (+),score=193.01 TRINITY_DN1857_c0_g1_i2:44-1636(+)
MQQLLLIVVFLMLCCFPSRIHPDTKFDHSGPPQMSDQISPVASFETEVTSLVVLGASGDLAKKKTFPSLFALYCLGLLPPNTTIFGYARSAMTDDEFRKHASQHFKVPAEWQPKRAEFLARLFYVAGQYDREADFVELHATLCLHEQRSAVANRVFYFAVPPSVFVASARGIRTACMPTGGGWVRLIVEKPFGRDLASSDQLGAELGSMFTEEQLYRIDHYLGKEMVQNLLVVRFGNAVFEPLWNRQHVANVVITFKEDIGTEGRGGYFDQFGIVRDVMQNHLLQMLALVAMETPVSLDAEDVRDEKVKVLRSCRPVALDDIVVGQYAAGGGQPGYLDDKTVPSGSRAATFATAVVHIDNPRWKGVPFILKCGKALNERKAEIRVQFRRQPNTLFPKSNLNELVMRVQPDEAVYLKFNGKVPGLSADVVQTELDLTYKQRFDVRLPDAYERLIYDAVTRGDHSLFVRADELRAAWRIFTPLLHELDAGAVQPEIYTFGSRGPAQADQLMQRYGFERTEGYVWAPKKAANL